MFHTLEHLGIDIQVYYTFIGHSIYPSGVISPLYMAFWNGFQMHFFWCVSMSSVLLLAEKHISTRSPGLQVSCLYFFWRDFSLEKSYLLGKEVKMTRCIIHHCLEMFSMKFQFPVAGFNGVPRCCFKNTKGLPFNLEKEIHLFGCHNF